MLRKKAASSAHPAEWRVDRSAYWSAGDLGDLVRLYHICFASDLPQEGNDNSIADTDMDGEDPDQTAA